MRKTIRNGIDRRAVYKFQCTGSCGRVKASYVYERAKKGICLTCSKHSVDPNQSSLFSPIEVKDYNGVIEMPL